MSDGFALPWSASSVLASCSFFFHSWRTAANVAFCKSYDTPSPRYLIPYYLRDVRTHFMHYASVRKGKQSYMTVDDLVAALLALPSTSSSGTPASRVVITPKLRALYEATDINTDGLVSFAEFRILAALLQLQTRELSKMFRLVDKDGVEALTVPQLALLLYASTGDEELYYSLRRVGDLCSSVSQSADRHTNFSVTTTTTDPATTLTSCPTVAQRDTVTEGAEESFHAPQEKAIRSLGVLQHLFRRSIRDGGNREKEPTSFLSANPSCPPNHAAGSRNKVGESVVIPRCTEADILALQGELEEEIWTAEFMRFTTPCTRGTVERREQEPPSLSAKHFMQLVASRVIGPHPPYYLEANIRQLSGAAHARRHSHSPPRSSVEASSSSSSTDLVVTLPVWLALNRVMKHAEEVSDVFAFFTATGRTVTRENIEKVFHAAGVPFGDLLPALDRSSNLPVPAACTTSSESRRANTSISVADVLFAVFDKNGDGQIDLEECLSVLRQRRQFYYRNALSTSQLSRVMNEKNRAPTYLEKLQLCAVNPLLPFRT